MENKELLIYIIGNLRSLIDTDNVTLDETNKILEIINIYLNREDNYEDNYYEDFNNDNYSKDFNNSFDWDIDLDQQGDIW